MRSALAAAKLLGTLVALSAAGQVCAGQLKQDDTGKQLGYLYSLQRSDGVAKSAPAANGGEGGKLVVGIYDCWIGEAPSAAGLTISGPSTYESEGKKGRYHVEGSGAVVFESGPYSTFHARLLNPRRIGMNMDGGEFFDLTCDAPK